MSRTTLALAALVFAASGCSMLDTRSQYKDYRSVGVTPLKNAQGHVIGHKETLRGNGEKLARLTLYVPRLEDGKVVGYEELVPGGSVLRSLNGRKVGGRFVDLRSQGTNPGNRGLTIIVHSKPAPERVTAPDIDQLRSLARLD
ncbi:MAG: hypothetical protein ACREUH_07855 [Burkholderiales bacterium]